MTVSYTDPPKVGDTLTQGGQTITAVRVAPYTRRDGGASFLIEWRHPDGRTGVTGMKSKDVRWGQDVDEALRLSAEARARRASGDEPPAPARPPRPAKPPAPPKARVNLMLDADIAAGLRARGDMSAFASAAIRAALDRLRAEARDVGDA